MGYAEYGEAYWEFDASAVVPIVVLAGMLMALLACAWLGMPLKPIILVIGAVYAGTGGVYYVAWRRRRRFWDANGVVWLFGGAVGAFLASVPGMLLDAWDAAA